MNIRAKVRLAAWLPALFALLIGAALWISWAQVDLARQNADLADGIRQGITDLNSLSQEYLLYGSPRAAIQLEKQQAKLRQLLETATFQVPADRETLAALRQGHDELDRLVELLLKGQAVSRDQIVGALLIKVHDLRFKARQLAQDQHKRVVTIQRRSDAQILVALAVLTVLTMVVLLVLGKRLVQGMDHLAEGIRRVENGDLEHVVQLTGADELGALARAFNDMTGRLRASYTSIERLNQEIQERELAEQARRDSEGRFRRLFHEAPMPLCHVGTDGRLADINARFEQVFGYTREDMPTLADWWRLAFPDAVHRTEARETWEAAVARAAGTGEDIEAKEYHVTSKDGSQRTMLISGITLGESLLVSFFDITERQQAEAEIRRLNADLERRVVERTAELTAANRELDAFAYAVSHDLRAPLRAMNGFSQALLEDYGGQLQGEARVYLEQIGTASRRMSELIDGILTLSRSTRGEMQHDAVDLSALAESQLAELARDEPERRVATQVESGLMVRGDGRMVEVMMRNLLENAWKYSARNADASIRVYRENPSDAQHICVADNGAGFDMAHANHLFQPFQRLHRQEEFPGIGIGLATVQRIVHRHGGSIQARGEPGLGATFCFSLPGLPEAAAHNETEV